MHFLSDQKNWRAPRLSPTLIIFPNLLDQNSEIAILFNVVKKPNNYVFGDDLLPHSPCGTATSYKLWPVLTYSNGYWKCTDIFRGIFWLGGKEVEKRGICWGNFPWKNLSWRKKIKQFVVTNCSKEQPDSIVTETLKNGILISIVTSKESHFNADFKYINFIKISFIHRKLRSWENLPHFWK